MATHAIVEKKNHLHLHQLHDSKDSAERSLREVIPEYVRRGYYMDKSLTADDFEVIEYGNKNQKRKCVNS